MSSRMPPMEEVLSTAKFVVLPAATVAAGVMILAAIVLAIVARIKPFDWRQALRFSTPVAVFAAIAAVNHFRDQPFPWWPDGKWWHEAIFLFAAALLVDLISLPFTSPKRERGESALPVAGASGSFQLFNPTPWLIGLVGGLAASVVISPNLRTEMLWMLPVAAGAIAINGLIAHRFSTHRESTAIGVVFTAWTGAVSMVLLHAKSLGFADLALGASVAFSMMTAFGWITKSTIRTWAITMPLTGLLLMNRQLVDSEVPRWLLTATGAIPSLLLIGLIRPSARFSWNAVGLVVIASIAVVVTAAVVAPMTFEPQEW